MSTQEKKVERFVIVVGVDSSSSTYAVEAAARFARSVEGSEIHLVHALENFQAAPRAEIPDSWDGTAILERGREHLQKLGDLAAAIFEGRIIGHLASGQPWREIVQLAERLTADLVVVGSHNLTGVRRLVLGSVSEHVVRMSKCPVFVVRKKDYTDSDVPQIEPACPDCLAKQKETGGESLWCDRHTKHHPHGRTYYEVPQSFAVGSSLLRP